MSSTVTSIVGKDQDLEAVNRNQNQDIQVKTTRINIIKKQKTVMTSRHLHVTIPCHLIATTVTIVDGDHLRVIQRNTKQANLEMMTSMLGLKSNFNFVAFILIMLFFQGKIQSILKVIKRKLTKAMMSKFCLF